MYISRDAERQLDIKSVFRQHSIAFVENNTHVIMKKCPMCGGRNKLMVDRKNKKWVCFKCVETDNFDNKAGRGNLLTLLRDVMGLSEEEMKSVVNSGQALHYTDPDMMFRESMLEQEDKKELTQIVLPQSFYRLEATNSSVRSFPEAYRYLINRKVVDPNLYRSFDLRYDPNRKRVIFPIYSDRTTVVGWQGRDITDRWKHDHAKCGNDDCELRAKYYFLGEEMAPFRCPNCLEKLELQHYPKSLNSSNFPKSLLLFNQQNVDWNQPVAIVEGPFDCINTPNSVGMLGKTISTEQLNYLLGKAKDLVLYFDGDDAGTFSTASVSKLLKPFFPSLKVAEQSPGLDPGTFCLTENRDILTRAIDSDEWLRRHQQF